MSIFENVSLALASLWSNKMRALLTMLGIIIGIGSVITIFTIGNSLNGYIASEMSAMGANTVNIYVTAKTDEFSSGFGPMNQPREQDLISEEMITELETRFIEDIEAIGITVGVGSGTATNGENYANFSLSGVAEKEQTISNITMLNGRFLLEREIEDIKNVVVVSDSFVTNYGLEGDPIGQQIMLEGSGGSPGLFTIVGVYEYEQSAFSMGSTANDQDVETTAYIPYTTAAHLSGANDGYQSITVLTSTGTDSAMFAENATSYFNNRQYSKNEDFELSSFAMDSIIESMTSMLATLQLAISAVAAISLLVGGIGVMNIMLVSITERTKEIGTRKALGATNFSIRVQFITESSIICIIGGAIGILIGVVLGSIASSLLDFPATPDLAGILIAVLFSFGIGLFFGYYPANKAAKLDPIDALRYE